jgi:hypothetical protein
MMLTLCLLSFASGCEQTTGQAPQPDQASSKPTEPWDWSQYPTGKRLRVTTVPARLQPRRAVAIKAPVEGWLRLSKAVDKRAQTLTADKVWGRISEKQLADEAADLEKAKQLHGQRVQVWQKVEQPKQRATLEQQLQKIDRQLENLALFERWPDEHELLAQVLPEAQVSMSQVTRALLKTRRQGLKEQLRRVRSDARDTAEEIELASKKLTLRTRQRDLARRRRRSVLRMPFEGKLRLDAAIRATGEAVWVSAGQRLAQAFDLSSVQIRVSTANMAWLTAPRDQLTVEVKAPTDEMIEATFRGVEPREASRAMRMDAVFDVRDSDRELAKQMLYMSLSGTVWRQLQEKAMLVPKVDLVEHAPDRFAEGDWRGGVDHRWDGEYRVVAVGDRHVAVVANP